MEAVFRIRSVIKREKCNFLACPKSGFLADIEIGFVEPRLAGKFDRIFQMRNLARNSRAILGLAVNLGRVVNGPVQPRAQPQEKDFETIQNFIFIVLRFS